MKPKAVTFTQTQRAGLFYVPQLEVICNLRADDLVKGSFPLVSFFQLKKEYEKKADLDRKEERNI